MRSNDYLDRLIQHSKIIDRQLYIVRDSDSERTYLECFVKTQEKLRYNNWDHVANLFLHLHIDYQDYRMNNPFKQPIDRKWRDKVEQQDNYKDWIEGNTIHKKD